MRQLRLSFLFCQGVGAFGSMCQDAVVTHAFEDALQLSSAAIETDAGNADSLQDAIRALRTDIVQNTLAHVFRNGGGPGDALQFVCGRRQQVIEKDRVVFQLVPYIG